MSLFEEKFVARPDQIPAAIDNLISSAGNMQFAAQQLAAMAMAQKVKAEVLRDSVQEDPAFYQVVVNVGPTFRNALDEAVSRIIENQRGLSTQDALNIIFLGGITAALKGL